MFKVMFFILFLALRSENLDGGWNIPKLFFEEETTCSKSSLLAETDLVFDSMSPDKIFLANNLAPISFFSMEMS